MVIYKVNNIEIIDSTPEAEIRLSSMEYTEQRARREYRRKILHNPFYKLAIICKLITL